MKCPLILHAILTSAGRLDWKEADCIKEECAWWSVETNQCDPTGLIPWLRDIDQRLVDLVDKMPHAGQSTQERGS